MKQKRLSDAAKFIEAEEKRLAAIREKDGPSISSVGSMTVYTVPKGYKYKEPNARPTTCNTANGGPRPLSDDL